LLESNNLTNAINLNYALQTYMSIDGAMQSMRYEGTPDEFLQEIL